MTGASFAPQQIPDTLKLLPEPRWLVWSEREVPGRTKPLKVPRKLAGDVLVDANANDPSTWLTFDQAAELVRRFPGELAGVGLCPAGVLSDDQAWKLALLDFDNVWKPGEPTVLPTWLNAMAEQCNLYLELSPSGLGVRSYCWIPANHEYAKPGRAYYRMYRNDTAIGELFVHGGYCTFTGQALKLPAPSKYLTGCINRLEQFTVVNTTPGPGVPEDLAEKLDTIPWDLEMAPLDPRPLSSQAQEVFLGEGGHDRSKYMLPLLAALSWQCRTLEELCARAWQVPALQAYFIDHRAGRSDDHQMMFCVSECSKAWARRGEHMPVEQKMGAAPSTTPGPPPEPDDDPTRAKASQSLDRQEETPVKAPAYDEVYFLDWVGALRFPSPAWLIEGALVDAASNLLYGPSHTGKSLILQSQMVAVAMRRAWWMGRPIHRHGVCLYLASEGLADSHKRILSFCERNPSIPLLMGRGAERLRAAHVDRIFREVDMYCAKVGLPLVMVGVDTMVGHIDGNENAADEVQTFLERVWKRCFERDAAFVLTHHTGKDGSLRGSSNLEAFFDGRWRVDRSEGSTITKLHCEKARSFPPTMLHDITIDIQVGPDNQPELSLASGQPSKPEKSTDGAAIVTYRDALKQIRETKDESKRLKLREQHLQRCRATEHVLRQTIIEERASRTREKLLEGRHYETRRKLVMRNPQEVEPYPCSPGAAALDELVDRMIRTGLLQEFDGRLSASRERSTLDDYHLSENLLDLGRKEET